MEMIDSAIDQIRVHSLLLGDALTRLAKNFRYDEISAVIQQIKGVLSRKT
jgi:hypothetical protein